MKIYKSQFINLFFTQVSLVFLSTIFGFFIELTLANNFGVSNLTDAFRINYLIYTIGIQIFANSAFNAGIIPFVISNDKSHIINKIFKIAKILTITILLFVLIALYFRFNFFKIIFPSLNNDTLILCSYLFFSFGFSFLLALWLGIFSILFNAFNMFYFFPIIQIIFSFFIIIGLYILSLTNNYVIFNLLINTSIIISFIILFIIYKFDFCKKITNQSKLLKSSNREIYKNTIPLIINNILSLFFTIIVYRFLSNIDSGSISIWGYASKLSIIIFFIPMIFGNILFPTLVNKINNENKKNFVNTFNQSIRAIIFFSIVSSFFFFILKAQVFEIIYFYSVFESSEIELITLIFGILAFGVIFDSVLKIYSQYFHALKINNYILSYKLIHIIIFISIYYIVNINDIYYFTILFISSKIFSLILIIIYSEYYRFDLQKYLFFKTILQSLIIVLLIYIFNIFIKNYLVGSNILNNILILFTHLVFIIVSIIIFNKFVSKIESFYELQNYLQNKLNIFNY